MKTKLLRLLFLTIFLICCSIAGAFYHFNQSQKEVEELALEQTKSLIGSKDYIAAFKLVDNWRSPQLKNNHRARWLEFDIICSVKLKLLRRLINLHNEAPELLAQSEENSYWLGRAFLAARQLENYDRLRSLWRGREREKGLWLTADIDRLIVSKDRDEAVKLASDYVEKTDSPNKGVLTRLAALCVQSDRHKAWRLLSEALKREPKAPSVRLLRAEFLEAAGKYKAARYEYEQAYTNGQKNPLYRQRLSQFCFRTRSFDRALKLLNKFESVQLTKLEKDHLDFYGKVVNGRAGSDMSCANSNWLKLIVATNKDADIELSWRLKSLSNEEIKLAPKLYRALCTIFDLRFERQKVSEFTLLEKSSGETPEHTLYRQLAQLHKLSDEKRSELISFCRSSYIWSALFLAEGWREAALENLPNNLDAQMPEWFTYGIAQCMRLNKCPKEAISFLASRRDSSALRLLAAEINYQIGNKKEALNEIKKISKDKGPASKRARFLLGLRRES